MKSSDQLHSGRMQSPDEVDATYRDKKSNTSKDQAINVTETVHPDNPINLVTDVGGNAYNIEVCNVEATVNEFVGRMPPKKLEVRGAFLFYY